MFLQTERDYFLRKSLSKYLMGATDINKHDVGIFLNGTGKNMRVTYEDSSKLQGELDFAFDPQESEAKSHKEISLAELPSNEF
jgi:hypothetical protein